MTIFIIFLAVAIITIVFICTRKQGTADTETDDSKSFHVSENQYKKCFLMTINEKTQFFKIKSVTDELGLLLFSKVRMLDVVKPATNNYADMNRIIRKHLDFVILNTKGYTICAIEIDDNSHKSDNAQQRDNVKDAIMQSVGIPLLRYIYIDEAKLKETLQKMI